MRNSVPSLMQPHLRPEGAQKTVDRYKLDPKRSVHKHEGNNILVPDQTVQVIGFRLSIRLANIDNWYTRRVIGHVQSQRIYALQRQRFTCPPKNMPKIGVNTKCILLGRKKVGDSA
jgi:hypothetical protein